jgi:O-antigen/teichoic acid export membrane protein
VAHVTGGPTAGVRRVARGSFRHLQTGLVRIVGSLLQLALSLVLAHIAGAAVLGRFLFFVAVVNLCTAIGGGLPNLMLRYASADRTPGTPEPGWLWRHSIELSLVFHAAAAASAVMGRPLLRDISLAVGALLVQRIASAVLKALGRPNLGVLLDTALYPLVVLVCALAIDARTGSVDAADLSLAYTAALWVATVIAVTLTWGSPHSLRSSWSAPWRTARSLYAEIIAVTVGSAAQVVSANAPLTLAPLFLTDAQVGALGLALRVAGFAGTIIISLAAWFGPAFARADGPGELFHLRRQSQYACLALYLPVPIAFLLLPAAVLERVSPDLGSVKVLVLILSVGYLVNAATGLAPTLMVMRGWSRSFSAIRVAAAALTVGLLLVGGALGGAIGLAVASSVAMVGENVWMFVASGRRLQSAASFSVASSGHVGDAGGDPAVR